VDVAQAGRERRKIANANNNGLKTTGDHIEPAFGHSTPYRAAFLRSLNRLACLGHTVLEWGDAKEALLRHVLTRRPPFFDDSRAVTRYVGCESWPHWMDCMIRGLELEARLESKLNTS